jgi:cell division protein FtsW (lipid II flippase)
MSEILILLTIVAIIVLMGVVMLWKTRKKVRHEPDYRAFFWMGLVWIIAGAGFMFVYDNLTFNGLFAMGVIFFIIGAANRNKWKKQTPAPSQKWLTIMGVSILVIGIAVMALLVYV